MEHEVEVLPHVVLVQHVLPEAAFDVSVKGRAADAADEAARLGVLLRDISSCVAQQTNYKAWAADRLY